MRFLKSFHHIRSRIILLLTALMILSHCLPVNIYATTDWSRFMQSIDGYYQNGFWNIYRPGLIAVRFSAKEGDYSRVTLTENGEYVICYNDLLKPVSRVTVSNYRMDTLPADSTWSNGKLAINYKENGYHFQNKKCNRITVYFLDNGTTHSIDNVLDYTTYENGVLCITVSEDAQYFCLWKSDSTLSEPFLIHRAAVDDFEGVPQTIATPSGRIYIMTDSSAKTLIFDEESIPGSHYKNDDDIQTGSLVGPALLTCSADEKLVIVYSPSWGCMYVLQDGNELQKWKIGQVSPTYRYVNMGPFLTEKGYLTRQDCADIQFLYFMSEAGLYAMDLKKGTGRLLFHSEGDNKYEYCIDNGYVAYSKPDDDDPSLQKIYYASLQGIEMGTPQYLGYCSDYDIPIWIAEDTADLYYINNEGLKRSLHHVDLPTGKIDHVSDNIGNNPFYVGTDGKTVFFIEPEGHALYRWQTSSKSKECLAKSVLDYTLTSCISRYKWTPLDDLSEINPQGFHFMVENKDMTTSLISYMGGNAFIVVPDVYAVRDY